MPLAAVEHDGEGAGDAPASVSPSASAPAAAAPVPSPARLIIVKMVLHNFKSYAGTKEIGPFHKNFSSVVGPNGSGKSNVIDALLFVLGRRANQIRLKKLSELIHKSDMHRNLRECRVDVHFAEIIDGEERDSYHVVPGSEFVVSRRATHESVSTYMLNHRNCTWESISNLLQSKGMDLDNNRFLILQGEVEQIALMKPKALTPHDTGLLEYMEDIIGTNKYVSAIAELNTKVETINEQRGEKLQRLKQVEKDKEKLQGPKDEAEEYARTQHQLNVTRIELAQIQRAEAVGRSSELDEQKAKLEEEDSKLKEEITACTTQLKSMEKEYSKKQNEHDSISRTVAQCKSDFASFERKDVKQRETIKHKKSLLKKTESRRNKAAEKSRELRNKIRESEQELPKAQTRIEALQHSKQREEAIQQELFDALVKASEPYKAEIESLQKSLMPLQQASNAAQQQVDVCNSEIDVYKDKMRKAENAYNELKATIVKQQQEAEKKKVEQVELEGKIKATRKQQEEVTAELQALTASESTGLAKRTQLMSALEDRKHAAASSSSQSKILSALLAAKKKGVLPGLYGRLGDLASIDAQYDVAITMGVGALDMILVDDARTGAKAIHFLKSNNLGRARFLALDKQNFAPERLAKMTETPEGVPRLFDLIQCKDSKIMPAFYFACRDTLVAMDLEQATRIGLKGTKRWRVVTLDGKVVDTAGTMSGGGADVRRGGMLLTGSAAARAAAAAQSSSSKSNEPVLDVKAAEAELAQLESNLAALKTRRRELETRNKELTKIMRELESAHGKASSSVRELTTSISEYRTRAASLEKSLHLSGEELAALKELESKQAEHLAELNKAKKAAKTISDKIAVLQQRIMEKGGAKLEAQKKKVEAINTELDQLEEAANRMSVLAETGNNKLAKLAAEEKDASNEARELESEIESLMAAFKQIEEDAIAVHQAMQAAERELADASKSLDSIQSDFERLKSALNKLNSSEVDLAEKKHAFHKLQKEHLMKAAVWDKKINQLLQAINEEMEARRKDAEMAAEEMVEDEEQVQPESFEPYTLLNDDAIAALDRRAIDARIHALEQKLGSLKANPQAIADYRRITVDYNRRASEFDAVTAERDAARRTLDDLRARRLSEFMGGFALISIRLKEMYQMLTLGGDAELELVDSLDPFSEGIVFSVRPPKKSWKNISNLSGGEKTLSSLALVFALHHVKPNPLYVMDEIDAALDFKNVSIVANYIKERTKNAQFIIISLRNNMFELADRLVGIYKTNNQTKSITIDPRLFEQPKTMDEEDEAESEDEEKENDQENQAPTQSAGKKLPA